MKIPLFFIGLVIIVCCMVSPIYGQGHGYTHPKKTLVVGVVHDPPFTMKNDKGEWTGFNIELWSHVAHILKVSYRFQEMHLNNLLLALEKGVVDVSIVSLSMTPQREARFDFTQPFGTSRIAVASLPGRIEHPWWGAIGIFFSWGTIKVVFVILFILFMVGCVMWLIERKINPEHFGNGILRGIISGIYWVGSTLASGVCFGISLKSLTGRLLGLVWMFVCAIVLSAFIASLTTSLTAKHFMGTIINDRVLKKMRLGTVSGSIYEEELKRIGASFSLFEEEEEVLEALLNKKIDGFLYDEFTLHYYGETKYRNGFDIYPTSLRRIAFAFSVPLGSPLRKKINGALLQVMDEPTWTALLHRYGIGENFEEQEIDVTMGRRRRLH